MDVPDVTKNELRVIAKKDRAKERERESLRDRCLVVCSVSRENSLTRFRSLLEKDNDPGLSALCVMHYKLV
jgi:hypothetical protein